MNFGDPTAHAHRRVGKFHARRADAFDQDELLDALRKGPGIEPRNSAAHGMTDELELPCAEGSDDAVQIKNIIGKMIIAAGADPTAVAVTSAVRCDDPQRLPESFLKELDEISPAASLIQEPMNQD